MEVIVTLGKHPVYKSIFRMLKYAQLGEVKQFEIYKPINLLITPTFRIQSLDISFSRENVYVLNSPIIAVEDWIAASKGITSVIVEEYFSKSNFRDEIAKIILKRFKNYPFIAMTKRTNEFLLNAGLTSFLVPPATEKRRGRKNRDIILFVGRMTDSKNPLFILEVAKKLKNENFIMIGKGPLSYTIKEKAKTLPNVEVIDFVDNEKLFSEFYSRAKVVIHPAIKDPVGFTIIEALSASTPVLASIATGASDFLPKKWVLNNFDLDLWLKKIKEIGSEDLSMASQVFKNEHLDIDDKYYKYIAGSLRNYLFK